MERDSKGKIKIDEHQLKSFMRLKPTLKDTAAFFECSVETIERRCKEFSGVSFVEFRDQNMVHTRHALVRKAIQLALQGNVPMLIFCLKNVCGWTDKQVVESTVKEFTFKDRLQYDTSTN